MDGELIILILGCAKMNHVSFIIPTRLQVYNVPSCIRQSIYDHKTNLTAIQLDKFQKDVFFYVRTRHMFTFMWRCNAMPYGVHNNFESQKQLTPLFTSIVHLVN